MAQERSCWLHERKGGCWDSSLILAGIAAAVLGFLLRSEIMDWLIGFTRFFLIAMGRVGLVVAGEVEERYNWLPGVRTCARILEVGTSICPAIGIKLFGAYITKH